MTPVLIFDQSLLMDGINNLAHYNSYLVSALLLF